MNNFIFVNDELVVFNKPAGMPSHPLKNKNEKITAFDEVTQKYPEIKSIGENNLEGGLIHRLDNDTSGLLLFARHENAFKKFRKLLQDNQIQKNYIALISGFLEVKMVLNEPIAHHSKNKKKMVVVKDHMHHFRGIPKPAVTFVKPIAWATDKEATLVSIQIQGGRRHQIRVHLASAGYPLIGDVLYKGPKAVYLPGQALHADSITAENFHWTATVPELFKKEAAKYGIGF